MSPGNCEFLLTVWCWGLSAEIDCYVDKTKQNKTRCRIKMESFLMWTPKNPHLSEEVSPVKRIWKTNSRLIKQILNRFSYYSFSIVWMIDWAFFLIALTTEGKCTVSPLCTFLKFCISSWTSPFNATYLAQLKRSLVWPGWKKVKHFSYKMKGFFKKDSHQRACLLRFDCFLSRQHRLLCEHCSLPFVHLHSASGCLLLLL